MQIGILGGTGPAGSALASRLAAAGHDVVIGSRDPSRAAEKADDLIGRWPDHELRISGSDNSGASRAEIVVVATPWDAAVPTAAAVADELRDKIVISMANALTRIAGEFQPLLPARGSIAAGVQAVLPASRVVAAFQHVPARELGDLDQPIVSDVLVCSDHPDATATVIDLIGGMDRLRGLDAGPLAQASPIESFTAVLLQLNVRYRTRVAPTLTGLPEDTGRPSESRP